MKMPRFQDYMISKVYSGAVTPPDFGSLSQYEGTDLRCYSGEPSAYSQEKINFAGHFIIDSCSCGSECKYFFMWDATDGKVYGRLPPGVINVHANLAIRKNAGATY